MTKIIRNNQPSNSGKEKKLTSNYIKNSGSEKDRGLLAKNSITATQEC